MGTRIAFSLSALQHSIFSRFSSFLFLFFITFLRWGQFVECLLIWVLDAFLADILHKLYALNTSHQETCVSLPFYGRFNTDNLVLR